MTVVARTTEERDHSGASPRVLAYDVYTALGLGAEAHRSALREGRSGLVEDARYGPRLRLGAVSDLPDMPRAWAPYTSRAARILRVLIERLREHPSMHATHPSRVGVVVATSTGGLDRTEALLAGSLDADAYSLDAQHSIAALPEFACEILGATGPRVAVSTACTSGAKAFAIGRGWLRRGWVDLVVVAAADGLCGTTVRGFHSLGVTAAEACHPFAASPTGMSVGEGGAAFLLALDAGDGIAMVGYGESSDSNHLTSPDPRGDGCERAIRAALADARRSSVDHVNAHGTGTAHNDASEAAALERTIGRDVPTSSTKGATGHLLGAAASVEAAFAAIAIEHGEIPPTIGASTETYAGLISVSPVARSARVHSVLSTSVAFGGSNTALLFAARGLP